MFMPFWTNCMCRAAALSLFTCLTFASAPTMAQAPKDARAETVPVQITNESEPVLCAEKDNVSVSLASPRVKSFRIEAAHPVYLSTMQRDSFEPDWTDCDMSGDPVFAAPVPPRRVTFYEQVDFWLVGMTFPTFWRPADTLVRVGDRVEKALHLVQYWNIRPMGGEELLVLYPQDGYWRLRPKAPAGMDHTAFGSSFLIGPIEHEAGRPIVRIKEVAFDPATKTFDISFALGGSAKLQIVEADQNRFAVHVTFDKPIEGRPFAVVRSMYITEFNNDAARVAVREKDAKGWREDNVMTFKGGESTDLWIGRLSPSRHNTSSPDHVFNSFSQTDEPRRPRAVDPHAKPK